MKYLLLILTIISSTSLFSQEIDEDGSFTFVPMPSLEMRNQICSQLANPFSLDNLNVVYSEIKSKFPDSKNLYFKGSQQVNNQMAAEVKTNCKSPTGELQIFNHPHCIKSCDTEFKKLNPTFIKSVLNHKGDEIEMCYKSCDAVQISYYSAVKNLTPVYKKLNELKEELSKCPTALSVLNSNRSNSLKHIDEALVHPNNKSKTTSEK